MDFEFTIESRKPTAFVHDEQTVFGDWLTHDLGNDKPRIKLLLEMCDLLLSGGLRDYQWQSQSYLLQIENREVIITETGLLADEDSLAELGDSLDLHETNHSADCGLEDFRDILSEWSSFLESL